MIMAEPGHQRPALVSYSSGPSSGAPMPGRIMMPNGQPPPGFTPSPQQFARFPTPMGPLNQPQPPVNGVSYSPQGGRPQMYQPNPYTTPTQSGPPKPINPPPSKFTQAPTGHSNMSGPISYQNGPQNSNSQPQPFVRLPNVQPSVSSISTTELRGPPYQSVVSSTSSSQTLSRGSPIPPPGVVGRSSPLNVGYKQYSPATSSPLVASSHPTPTSSNPVPMHTQTLPSMAAVSQHQPPPLVHLPTSSHSVPQYPPSLPLNSQYQHTSGPPLPSVVTSQGQMPPTTQTQSSDMQSVPQPPHQMFPTVAKRPPPPVHDQSNSHLSKRYPSQPGYIQPQYMDNHQSTASNRVDALSSQMGSLSVAQMGFNKIWGLDPYDLIQMRNILPPEKVQPPKIALLQNFADSVNCNPDIFRCTLTKIPETNSLLQKSRLPLGILIHPFKDLSQLPVIQCNTIVRCRACRTYINPFVYFVDYKRWKCNLCYRVNELPEEFQYDPVSKTYGDPSRRPEVKSATIEFIAPSEYMLRPPQPAVYLFVLEVSRAAIASGYLDIVCETLLEELDKLPGDSRTQIGFITFDSTLHFYSLTESLNQPRLMVVSDIDDVFLPCPENLLVNLHECRELIRDLLTQLPAKFADTCELGSSLGAALQASFKLMAAMGGRVTVFQVSLPSSGPGTLQTRGAGNAKDSSPLLNPATDFYKRLALECSGQQIAVDLFLLNSQYADLATLSGISRFSGGCIHHFPDFNGAVKLKAESLERCFRRYLTRKIGFEAVMRVRCTRGLAIHTFHGNFFVRSTDLLSLPNVNPDAGFGMQLSIEESLSDLQNVCFQAALLYTSSKGERRIRVHTLCLPIAANVSDILNGADQKCIVGLLAKMAVDRSQLSSLSDARDAFINVAVDVLSAYRMTQSTGGPTSGLLAPHSLRLLPLYIVALLKHPAFRPGQNVRVDDRLFAMCQMKSLPLDALIQNIYPDFYPVHYLTDEGAIEVDGEIIPQPPRLHLSAEKLDSRGLFVMDTGPHLLIYAGRNIAPELCQDLLGVPCFGEIPDDMLDLPVLDNPESQRLRIFVTYLQKEKPYPSTMQVIREDSKYRGQFIQYLLEDRSESALAYYEFLQHLKTQVK